MTGTRPTATRRVEHRSGRVGWLRAVVLGAEDEMASTASLLLGVTAAAASRSAVLVAGLAGLVAGAMSMAAGDHVSLSSQRDAERADITRERHRQATALIGRLVGAAPWRAPREGGERHAVVLRAQVAPGQHPLAGTPGVPKQRFTTNSKEAWH